MTQPLVSVLIPCFNAERYVGAALESVLAQTYAPIEVIVVDDSSTDASAGVIAGYAAQGVKLLASTGKGAAASRNQAFSASTGQFVIFLDADDAFVPAHVAALFNRLTGCDAAVAMGPWDRFSQDPAECSFPARPSYRDAPGPEWLITDWAEGMAMTQCGQFLIPRTLIEQAGGWNEDLSVLDDFEFFARLISRSQGVRFAQGAGLCYRVVAGSLSQQSSPVGNKSAFRALTLGTEHLLAVDASAACQRACANMLKTLDYAFYPFEHGLRQQLQLRIADLGGSSLAPTGPPAFQRLRRWIGWKAARRVQLAAQRFGLNRAARLVRVG